MSVAYYPEGLPEPTKKPRWGRLLALTLAGVLLFLALFSLGAAYGLVPTPVVNAVARLFVGRQPGAVPWATGQPVNILIMGLQVGGVSTNPLTDSMMVVSYDPKADSLSMLSIPRDLWVEIPGYGYSRINEAFELGGAAEAMLTVQQNLGIPVNYYALISFNGFEKLIDDVGGVTVDVPQDMDDPTYPADDRINYEPFQISKGIQHLNGHEALRYARSRHADPEGDIGRGKRQQQILMALKDQLLKPANILKMGLIIRDVRETIRTNFPIDQGVGLGLKALRAESVKKGSLGYENGAVWNDTTESGASVLMPNDEVIKTIVADLFGPALSYLEAGATVRVDNGNGYSGAATGFTRVLAGLGVEVVEPGDADNTDYPRAHVRAYTKDKAKLQEARLLASMLGVELEQPGGTEAVDVVITLGKDYAPYVPLSAEDWEEAMRPQ